MAIGAVGLPNHPVTNFVAGSNASEYVDAPASWPGRLNRFNGGFEPVVIACHHKGRCSDAKPFPRTFGARPLRRSRLFYRALAS